MILGFLKIMYLQAFSSANHRNQVNELIIYFIYNNYDKNNFYILGYDVLFCYKAISRTTSYS